MELRIISKELPEEGKITDKSHKSMVNHLTRIILKPVEEPLFRGHFLKNNLVDAQAVRNFGLQLQHRAERVALMMELLAAKEFSFHFQQGSIFADSSVMEGQEAKEYLLGNGFLDQEFQIFLEYGRKWGIM
ncbi:hypothetical protein UFO1_2874 [Pelosinus sp. UFO1]|nr:hypothetical protein UFO1_2874 [Pelosinus sp. UFO1]